MTKRTMTQAEIDQMGTFTKDEMNEIEAGSTAPVLKKILDAMVAEMEVEAANAEATNYVTGDELGGYDDKNDIELVEDDEYDDYEDDGQPDEYTEWQDYYDGDDWDQGQYDTDCDCMYDC